jgi:hypothetical protein
MMRLWEFTARYSLKNHNGSWWINNKQISDEDAEQLQAQLDSIKARYPASYYAKMSSDVLKAFFDRQPFLRK